MNFDEKELCDMSFDEVNQMEIIAPDNNGSLKQNEEQGDENQSSYRQILKATSLFGGVQVFTIIIGVIRAKFVAVFIGAAGVGIVGLLNSPLQLILSIASLGLSFSAVKEISEANGTADSRKVALVVNTLTKWSWIAGLIGTVITLIMSPFLSQWTFGNSNYTWAFMCLSVTLLMQILSKGQVATLQGFRMLTDMAKSNVFGAVLGLISIIPIYYFFGIDGIIPVFLITSFYTVLLSWYFARKVKVERISMSVKELFYHGGSMIKLGLVMTITGIVGFFMSYVLAAFIGRFGGVSEVGLYNAAWSVIGQSTGLVFAAMTADYFPRLSAVNKNNEEVSLLVNQQAEMVLLILGPIIVFLIGAFPLIVRILYTSEFMGTVVFATWMLVSILFKGIVWPAGFIFPAKGDLKIFGFIELTDMIIGIGTNIVGYYFMGLEGLGISMVINYILGFGLTLFFARKKYSFKYKSSALKIFAINLFLVTTVLIISYYSEDLYRYVYSSIVLSVAVLYSYLGLNKRLDVKAMIINQFNKIFKR